MTGPLRLMTWNIHGCVGRDRRRDPVRVADAIRSVAADVVAVQEVDVRPSHRDDVGLVERLCSACGPHMATSYPISGPDREYGIALISRYPIVSAATIDLAFRKREPRTAIDARLDTPAGPLRIIATHFGLSRRERMVQLDRLLGVIGERPNRTVVTGDFNDWRLPGDVGRRLGEKFATQIAPKSFPARWPLFCLDRVFASEDLGAREVVVHVDRAASDHRAVICEIDFIVDAARQS